MNRMFLIILLCGAFRAGAQDENALERVLKILTLNSGSYTEDVHSLKDKLTKSAWEALSYLEESEEIAGTEDLHEAVADYYRFYEDQVQIRLRQPGEHDYGLEMTLDYKIEGSQIKLLDHNGIIKDSWSILYLDDHYLALDMGGLRVFFTHAPGG